MSRGTWLNEWDENRRIPIRLTQDQWHILECECERRYLTMGQLVHAICRDYTESAATLTRALSIADAVALGIREARAE
jgi:hypothetical protein